MSRKPFIDTNIWIYAFSADDPRRERAISLIAEGSVVSVQILNEFTDVARRKLGKPWPEVVQALSDIEALCGPAQPLTADMQRRAVEIARRDGLRIYDSFVVSAAQASGCRILYSEDLQHGRVIDGLTIINPFAAGA